ncbi:GNAT family N-acetyltransferase [Paenibacillus sp. MMS20-IR301]|uniref:GNAT family N-acetyltransferase n=1 Tax=Paenibacillus sp. MMS20-IR301 TaxID=2895946 RepID=UPI0028E35E3F|nr:GNAT family N-acetyltransferase [Paenibacillus sp. MMS20-IR301]WNS41109.1 GNAT family N-acetyltransferase [Paenibacillus sp. MMS20-IR301]
MQNRIIRRFEQSDMAALGAMYAVVSAQENVLFWWVGEESNWENVICAFEGDTMVAKGQLGIFNVVPPGRLPGSKHKIFVNLKTLPERANDIELLDSVYAPLLERAQTLKSILPQEYGTILCTGNNAAEVSSHVYFEQHLGFLPHSRMYMLRRDLNEPMPVHHLEEGLELTFAQLDSPEERLAYLELDTEIWPDTALGMERLLEHQEHSLWTSIVVRDAGVVAGSLMVWKEEHGGIIEDVFVREPWRRRGIAKALLARALQYLKEHRLEQAQLIAMATNDSALSLYESVGFEKGQQEIRYYTELG